MSRSDAGPSIEAIRAAREQLGDRVRETPAWRWRNLGIEQAVGPDTQVVLKLELFQYAGTFKPRGALLNMLALDQEALGRGVTAVSAGNHAMAVAFAARSLGTTAKVVMPENADPARVAGCRALGAVVVFVPDVHVAFDEVRRIEREEKRFFVHPFEGERTVLGTATVGLELAAQVADLDAVIVPVGGGGLCAGVATAIRKLVPRAAVYGVEPRGADTMYRSMASGRIESLEKVRTIADSLAAPHTEPYTMSLCRAHVDEIVLVDDDAIRRAMRLLFVDGKLAVEPAGAAATAALCGPLRERLAGRRVALIVCGANTDPETFARHVAPAVRDDA